MLMLCTDTPQADNKGHTDEDNRLHGNKQKTRNNVEEKETHTHKNISTKKDHTIIIIEIRVHKFKHTSTPYTNTHDF